MRRARLRRVGKRLLQVVLGAAALYLVAMNVFLRTRLFRHLIDFDPGSFRLEYASAYSIIPGQIHVEGLAIRGRDSSVEWTLGIDACDFRVSFVSLAHHRFSASHVRGRGIDFRVRLRIDGNETTPEHLAAIPEIDGFLDPPFKDTGPPPAPLTDANYNLWSVDLEDVEAVQVRELWIDALRACGNMTVRGRWLFRPLRWLEVGPATVDLTAVDVSYGPDAVVAGVTGGIALTVHPYDVRVPEGLHVLEQVSATTSLAGSVPSLRPLAAWGRARDLALSADPGTFDAALRIDHGRLVAGAHVEARLSRVAASSLGRSVHADATISLDARSDAAQGTIARAEVHAKVIAIDAGDMGRATVGSLAVTAETPDVDLAVAPVDLQASEMTVRNIDGEAHGIGFRVASVAVRAPRARLPEGAPVDAAINVDVSGVEVPDLRDGNRLLPPDAPFAMTSGRATASAALAVTLPSRVATGWARVETRGAAGRVGPLHWKATLAARMALKHADLRAGSFDLDTSEASLDDVSATLARGASPLVIPHVEAQAHGLRVERGQIEGSVAVSLPSADVADLRGLGMPLGASARVDVDAGSVHASARGDIDVGALTFDGHASIALRGAALRVAGASITGSVTAFVHAKGGASARATDVSGSTIAFDDVGYGGDVFPTSGWWGRVELGDAKIAAGPARALRAHVSVGARDALPIDALLVATAGVPKWAASYVRMEGLHADADVRASGSSFELRSLVARCHDAEIRSWYETKAGQKDGAVYVDLGVVKAGIGLGAESGRFLLFGAREWFDDESAAFRARRPDGS